MADENFATAGRFRGAAGAVGPFNRDLPHVRVELKTGNCAGCVHRPLERPVQLAAGQIIGREERYAHGVQAGLYWNARSGAAGPFGIRDISIPVEELDSLAINNDFELLTAHLSQDFLKVPGDSFYGETVLAIRWELVPEYHASSRSKWQSLDVMILCSI